MHTLEREPVNRIVYSQCLLRTRYCSASVNRVWQIDIRWVFNLSIRTQTVLLVAYHKHKSQGRISAERDRLVASRVPCLLSHTTKHGEAASYKKLTSQSIVLVWRHSRPILKSKSFPRAINRQVRSLPSARLSAYGALGCRGTGASRMPHNVRKERAQGMSGWAK